MTTAAIVQARWASTRLPGKVLRPLRGRTVLAHVLGRAARIPGVDVVCCAVPDDVSSDPIAAEARAAGAVVFRGSETDVLGRYHGAAETVRANTVLRLTSDCPLLDPELCGRVLALLHERKADFATNNMPPSWPHGVDCEAFPAPVLARAAAEARAPYDREHVGPWMRREPGLLRVNVTGPGGPAARLRWTLDYPEDYDFLVALFAHLPAWPHVASTAEIVALLDAHPEIVSLNAARADQGRLAPPPAS
jgi:spore coat polysaccharide biosynthesis protein SpsF (cytidylyltransferase family)